MTIPSEPSGLTHAVAKILEVFTKPLLVISNAIAERLEIAFRRKPKLHVHFHTANATWCIVRDAENKMMQVGFMADFTHDDQKQTLLLVDAFPEHTRSKYYFNEAIKIGPRELVSPGHHIWMIVTPAIWEEGKNWKGRIIFVDQWKRKHKSAEKIQFRWVGSVSSSAPG